MMTMAAIDGAQAQQRADYEALVATHARANNVPEELVHRVIVRESRYRPDLVGRGGTIGLMQIKLGTARSLGYTGTAEGLRDPDTNLTYAVKYLAGAYQTAHGDHNRAVSYYAGGYYYAAKRQGRAPDAMATPGATQALALLPPVHARHSRHNRGKSSMTTPRQDELTAAATPVDDAATPAGDAE